MLRSGQRGFTMIELVVIIVVLGVLAAFAVPRFMGLSGRARVAAVSGMTGNIRSAANMAHGVWIATGNVSPITVDGININIVNGYPDAAGISSMIQDKTGFTVALAPSKATFTPTGAPTPSTCDVVYHQAPDANSPFTITTRTTAQLQGGC
jgi:MSHA pilin protein MshA